VPFVARLGQAWKVLLGHSADGTTLPGSRAAVTPAPSLASPAPSPPARRTAAESGPRLARHPHQIFISHSHEDRAFADDVVKALETSARRCWIAHRDVPAGAPSWAEPIVTAIARSRLVLVLLTARSIPSQEVLREVTLAADEKVPLLGVRLDLTSLSPGLRYFFVAGQRLDLADVTPAQQVSRILSTVLDLTLESPDRNA
jgi:hypothetical protein